MPSLEPTPAPCGTARVEDVFLYMPSVARCLDVGISAARAGWARGRDPAPMAALLCPPCRALGRLQNSRRAIASLLETPGIPCGMEPGLKKPLCAIYYGLHCTEGV